MAHCIQIMRTRENKDIAPGHSGPHCAVLACVSTGCTSPAANNKSLSLSQLDTPQPCLWLLRPTLQTEVHIRDLPAGYLVIPPRTWGDLKSLIPLAWIPAGPCGAVTSPLSCSAHPQPSAMPSYVLRKLPQSRTTCHSSQD